MAEEEPELWAGRASRRATALAQTDFETERGLLPEDTEEGSARFLMSLTRFLGQGNFRIPQVCGAPLDVAKLYREVCLRGGLANLVEQKKLKELGRLLQLEQTSVSYVLRGHYERLLLRYEQKFFRPDLVLGESSPSAGPPSLQNSIGGGTEGRTPSHLGTSAGGDAMQQSTVSVPALIPGMAAASAPADSKRAVEAGVDEEGKPKKRRILVGGALPPPPKMTPAEKTNFEEMELEHIRSMIVPAIGPYLKVELPLEDNEQVVRALESREPGAVAWALNALAMTSSSIRDLPRPGSMARVVELLEELVLEGLAERTPRERSILQAELPRMIEAELRPVPGTDGDRSKLHLSSAKEPHIAPFWWELEEGLMAPTSEREDAFAWALCASHILRNMAVIHYSDPLPIAESITALVSACVEYHLREMTFGSSELATNMLGIFTYAGRDVKLAALDTTAAATLLAGIVKCLQARGNCIRLRTESAMALSTVSGAAGNEEVVAGCVLGAGSQVLGALVELLHLSEAECREEIKSGRDADGGGMPESYVAEVGERHTDVMAFRMWGTAQVAAARALAKLGGCRVPGVREAVASCPRAVSSLIALLVQRPPSMSAGLQAAANAGQGFHGFPTIMKGYVQLVGKAEAAAGLALANLAQVEPTPDLLRAQEARLAEAAMTGKGGQFIAPLLAMIS